MIEGQLDLGSIRARPGSRLTDKDAIEVAPVLFALEKRHGVITPEKILEAAKDPDNVLHRFFEWDDEKAAGLQRLATARTLARSISYRVLMSGAEMSYFQPALVRVREADVTGQRRSGYVSLEKAIERPDLREQIVTNARKELESVLRRFKTLEALAGAVPFLEQAHSSLSRTTS